MLALCSYLMNNEFNYLLTPNLIKYSRKSVGWDSVVGILTVCGLEGLGIEFGLGVEIFCTCPCRLWGPCSLLLNGVD